MLQLVKKIVFGRWLLLAICLVWLVAQVWYVKENKYDLLVSDPGAYIKIAQTCVEHGTMYPNYSYLYDSYIFNPGWVNFIVLWLRLFGDVQALAYANVFFNAVILLLVYGLCTRLFERGGLYVACLSMYITMLLPSNFTIAAHTYSELFFMALSLATMYFTVVSSKGKKGTFALCLAGMFAALAMWTRPIALGWILACVCFLLFKRKSWRGMLVYVSSYAIVCMTIALFTHRNYPGYVYKGTTGGVNIIMGANDYATGAYCPETFNPDDGLGYIENPKEYTVTQKDSIWKSRAVQWIKQHPKRYASLTVTKLVRLYSGAPMFLYTFKSAPKSAKGGSGLDPAVTKYIEESTLPFRNYTIVVMGLACSSFFKLILWIALAGALLLVWRNKELAFVCLPVVVCTATTILTVGEGRYNMVMLPFIAIVAAYTIYRCGRLIMRRK